MIVSTMPINDRTTPTTEVTSRDRLSASVRPEDSSTRDRISCNNKKCTKHESFSASLSMYVCVCVSMLGQGEEGLTVFL